MELLCKVTPIPNKEETITKSQIELVLPFIKSKKAIKEATAKTIFIKCLTLLWVHPGVDNQPCNFAIATIEPVNVIAPTNIETDIETSLISDLKKSKFSWPPDIGKIAPLRPLKGMTFLHNH